MPQSVVGGHNVVLLVNGRLIGRVQSFSYTRRAATRRVQGVDQLHASELIRGPVVVSGQIGLVRVRRDGGAEGAGLIAPGPNLPREQYVSLAIKDRATDTILAQFDQCLVEAEAWQVATRALMTATVSFEAITVAGEVRPKG